MHPIEQLRYVARAQRADAGLLVQEAASALGVFRHDPAALVTAARRLLTRQPTVGPLWWMCSRLTTSTDVLAEAQKAIDELQSDRTGRELAHHLPDGATIVIVGWPDIVVAALRRRGDLRVLVVDVDNQASSTVRHLDRADVEATEVDAARMAGAIEASDVVVIEAAVAGPTAALTGAGGLAVAATARALGTPTWLVAGVGSRLPEQYWQAIVERTVARETEPWTAAFEVVSFGLIHRVVTADGVQLLAELAPSTAPLAAELLRELP